MASPGPSTLAVLAIGSVWFASSAVLSTYANSAFLKHFEDPILHTLVRFFGSAIFGYVTYCMGDGITLDEIGMLVNDVFVPALLLWIANFSNSVALQVSGVTLTYVVKASIPVFTVIVCTLQGQKFSSLTYASLLPICLGVALASKSDLSFSYKGLGAALVSALAQTFMNLSIKKVRNRTGHTGSKAFFGMTILCTLFTLPIVVGFHQFSVSGDNQSAHSSVDRMHVLYADTVGGDYWPLILLVAGAIAYHVEYALNFVFVGFVSSVTFSVCDIARRVAIIVTGAIVFNKSLTSDNWRGIGIALSGVLWYSYLEGQSATPATPVPQSAAPQPVKTLPPRGVSEVVETSSQQKKSAAKSPAEKNSSTTPLKRGKSPSKKVAAVTSTATKATPKKTKTGAVMAVEDHEEEEKTGNTPQYTPRRSRRLA